MPGRLPTPWLPLVVLVTFGLLAAACGSAAGPSTTRAGERTPQETTMREDTTTPGASPTAEPSATQQAGSPAESTAGAKASAGAFRLTSTAFSEGGKIPIRFTCDGADESPDLSWEDAPNGTGSLALIVDDPDARGFIHWVVYNLTGSQSGGLATGVSASPDAPPQGTNSFRKVGYGGPCPPSGTHHYRFTLLALDEALPLTGAPTADQVRTAAEGHVLDETVLTGTYTRR